MYTKEVHKILDIAGRTLEKENKYELELNYDPYLIICIEKLYKFFSGLQIFILDTNNSSNLYVFFGNSWLIKNYHNIDI